ncbi:MAG: 50S ribosomal protein L5 [Nanoarchaeota archaeon]
MELIQNQKILDVDNKQNIMVKELAKKATEVQTTDSKKLSKPRNENKMQNKMRDVEIEKLVLHCGGIDDKLEKSVKLLKKITNKKVYIKKSTKRVPEFGISPGKQSGCKVTIRDKDKIYGLLKRFFSAFDNTIKRQQITENQFCFGIKEYIEVPGLDYERDIGILGFEVRIVFKRRGKRVKFKKIKRGKLPKKQLVSQEEIVSFLSKNFGVEIV